MEGGLLLSCNQQRHIYKGTCSLHSQHQLQQSSFGLYLLLFRTAFNSVNQRSVVDMNQPTNANPQCQGAKLAHARAYKSKNRVRRRDSPVQLS